jgi:hypothetical protein
MSAAVERKLCVSCIYSKTVIKSIAKDTTSED